MKSYSWLFLQFWNSILLLNPRPCIVIHFTFFSNQTLLLETKCASACFRSAVSLYRDIAECLGLLLVSNHYLHTKKMWPSLKQVMKFNIYSPNASSTSINVPCNSTLCHQQNQCSATQNTCPYQISYVSEGTSSTGYLVEDVLHLITDDHESKVADSQITFG